MRKISIQQRAAVLRCLVEGNSCLSTSRITGTAKNTVLDYLVEAGLACADYQNRVMRDLPCKVLQLDEIWSFVGCTEKMKEKSKRDHPGAVWTWTALCADTKLIPSWRVGERSAVMAFRFCADLAKRFNGHLQITSDGLESYRVAVCANFADVDFAQLIKRYGLNKDGEDVVIGIRKKVFKGNPEMSKVSTSYIERSNLSIRMGNRRFTRKTNAFSKKLENHCHMLALGFMHYNFGRKHATLKKTPAEAAGVSDHRWSFEEMAEMIEKYLRDFREIAFHAAFEERMQSPRTMPKAYEPQEVLTPWYLDPESGGPNPAVRKPGIRYQDDSYNSHT